METNKKSKAPSPAIAPYAWLTLVMITIWLAFMWYVYEEAKTYNGEFKDMWYIIRGTVTAPLLAIIFFCLHSEVKAWQHNTTSAQVAKLQVVDQREFSLEIRAAGLAIDEHQQSTIWKMIKKKNDNFASIFSQDPKDYPETAHSRSITADINMRASFRHSARDAVAYWPVPTFALMPPDPYQKDYKAADIINSGKNAATLGVTLFLWQDDANTTHAQEMINNLFQFFDDNAEIPEAFIASADGDVTRDVYRKRGTPALQDGHTVPTIYESMTGLLVARSDRVNQYLRPYATNEKEDNQNRNSDLGKLWQFYWKYSPLFRKVYEDAKKAEGFVSPDAPGTMSSAYWHEQLPELWKTIDNRGPGRFQPTKWLPVRWAEHQIKEFDAAPTLGYLHRPIKVLMTDENGKQFKTPLQAKALQAGWLEALATLPEGEQPVRVFYDSTDNIQGIINLTNALHGLNIDGTGLEPGNVDEGYDLGRRLGNTGVSSALVAINLATIASYLDGGTSAVVYSGSDGSTTVQMVRPPSEETKANNAKTRWADPFKFGAPGSGQ
jgi:hypothetical protein